MTYSWKKNWNKLAIKSVFLLLHLWWIENLRCFWIHQDQFKWWNWNLFFCFVYICNCIIFRLNVLLYKAKVQSAHDFPFFTSNTTYLTLRQRILCIILKLIDPTSLFAITCASFIVIAHCVFSLIFFSLAKDSAWTCYAWTCYCKKCNPRGVKLPSSSRDTLTAVPRVCMWSRSYHHIPQRGQDRSTVGLSYSINRNHQRWCPN